MLYATSLFVLCAPAYAGGTLPTGGQFAAGQGAIASNGNDLTIDQASSHGIINWQSFSIGSPNSVQFNNGSGATLNRVTGGDLSRIDGSLSATGSVYLINPQGVVVGPGGKIVTNGSFVASTRDIPNGQFMAGGAMTASGTSTGDVVNAGTITSKTGDAILVGRSVVNSGTINAPEGRADLAAGNEIILQPVNGNSHIAISGGKGDVTNTGTVKAAQAALDSAGGNVYALVQNNGGIVSATGTSVIDGHVWLTAGGSATVSGTLSAQNADGSGGEVTVRGQDVSVSGSIDASATQAQKNGGDVSVIAKDQTLFTGTIKARGGAGGQGGTVETSGDSLAIGGSTVDAGAGGLWLLDPYDLTVDSSAAAMISTSLDGGTDVTLQTTATSTSGPGNADASGSGDINIDSAIGWGSTATLTLDAYHSIFVNAPITLTGGGGVVLKTNQGGSGGVYDFGLTDSGFAGNIDFGPSDLGGTLSINSMAYSLLYTMDDVAGINGGSGHYALATTIDASSAGTYSSAIADTLPGTLTGLGNSISNLTINDTSGNNNVGLIGYGNGTVRDLAVTGADVTGGTGAYVGILAGHSTAAITNVLTSGQVEGGDAGGSNFAIVGGLAGYVNGGSIKDTITAVAVTQGDASSSKASYAGGIAGRLLAASITGSHASGDVIGGAGNDNQVSYSGGLVGQANGASTIMDSYATGSVSGGFHAYVGGLAGDDGGTITDSYATGTVSDDATEQESRVLAGGLVGYAHGTIDGSYATGAVTSPDTSRAGGLVGYNSGTISDSYASGAVSTGDAGMSGGLVGFASGGTITGSHASGAVETGDAIVTYGPTVVTNSYGGGFIGYVNTAATTITLSYATGAASGGATSYVGGFAGHNNGSISQSYATGSATTGDGPLTFLAIAGGFVGYNSSNGTIAETYSTGAVTSTCADSTACASVILGGLVGKNISTVSAIKQSYFNSETSGQTTVGADFKLENVVELTTAEFQSGLPSGFNGGGNGRPTDSWAIVPGSSFPYLAAQFSGTPQVISGTAYTDGGVSLAISGTVSLLADGFDLGSATTGANGYYYILLPSGTVTSGTTAVLASSDGGNPGSRLDTGADALDGNGNVSGFDIWGGTLIAPTSETTYSGASATTLQSQDAALISTAIGGYADPTTGLSNYGYIASGDFVVDQSLTLSNGLYVKSLGDIAVPYALTLPDANGLTLDAAGTLTIDAPITVSGAGAVSLAYDDSDGSNLSFRLMSNGFAGSIDFTGGSGSGASLAINGAAYTLLYSLSDLAGINTDSGLQDNYALATSLDASSWGDWTPLGTDGAGNLYNSNNGFSGSFTGLGHIVSDLTVDTGSKNYAGLFGYASGPLRDIGIVASSVTGNIYVGSLVGLAGSSVSDAYATATVNGLGYVGGLIGRANSAVTNTYATGTVDGVEYVGGLMGASYGTVTKSYATGAVTATSEDSGGLIGFADATSAVSNSYATGAVNGKDFTGGLIGETYGSVTNVYATGAVSGRNNVGGLVGYKPGHTVTNGYWDIETSGQSSSAGGTGLTTATFQADSLATLGFDSSVWSTGDGFYPYLTTFFPNGAQAITGVIYSDAGVTPLASGSAGAATVSALADGAALGSATTGANGYYYILMPNGTLSGSQQLLTYLDGASTTANTYVADVSGNTSADLYGGWLRMISDAPTVSAMLSGLSTAQGSYSGSDFFYGGSSTASLGIVSGNTAGFAIDAALNVGTETISLDATGPVTQSAALTAANLLLLGSGADYTLTNSANAIGTLAADSGAIDFANDTDLTIGTVLTTAGITSTGAVTLNANGNISLDKSIETSGGDIVLAADQNFVNNVGASPLMTTGRWLIYSAAPGSDIFGGLDSGNTAIWNEAYATLPPASVTQSGNRYLFATQPTLTITTTDLGKTYGDDATSAVAAAYTISGYETGITGVYLGDTASSVYSGTPSVTSAGAVMTADVAGSPYAITGAAGSMSLLNGYALNFVDSGTLTVDPASLSITAGDVDATSLANVQFTSSYSGFVNSETSTVLSGLQYGLFPVSGNSLQYDIVPFGASAANYTISYYGGLLTIAQPSAPIITDPGNGSTNIGTQSLSDFTLSGNFGVFSFDNVTTASIDGSDSLALLFQVGLPGTVSPFDAITLGDYSNATETDDQLRCPSEGAGDTNTSCMGAVGP